MKTEALVTRRRYYLGALYVLVAILGLREALLPPGRLGSDYLLALGIGLALTALVAIEARLVDKPLPLTAWWVILLFWPVAVPGCIIGLRKLAGVKLVLFHTAVLFGVYLIFGLGAMWLAA
jgi:hypothetical protein